ncbi:hypothetical protein K432DRAFT_400876 [Lepidopterella palustris CBS 459.81]|uniref:RRM domain-containing protein n=1 Tax=Lepidopterella palustris CBS 459.81 TaxID=1314670 RepID=A0A8E2EJ25_9PEZI|nr:hypothetical protein K432DRAFT_400876 [Lepidopterella palustris CBS 459.81]
MSSVFSDESDTYSYYSSGTSLLSAGTPSLALSSAPTIVTTRSASTARSIDTAATAGSAFTSRTISTTTSTSSAGNIATATSAPTGGNAETTSSAITAPPTSQSTASQSLTHHPQALHILPIGPPVVTQYNLCATPTAYRDLTFAGVPTWDLALRYLPFRDLTQEAPKGQYGAPYDTVKNEVVAFLGRNARILVRPAAAGSAGFYQIHVAFDRQSGKAHDTFVEFETMQAAHDAVQSFLDYERIHRHPRRLGNRPVKVTVSSQAELMQSIFQRTKCCTWVDNGPQIRQPAQNESPFKGFVVEEELRTVIRHAEKPGKTLFGKDSPQRPYEAIISLLVKYPWSLTLMYTLRERNMIFHYVEQLIGLLIQQVAYFERNTKSPFCTKLTQQLLTELAITAITCHGFATYQRCQLISMTHHRCQLPSYIVPHRLWDFFPFEVVSVDLRAQSEIVEYWAILMHMGTISGSINDVAAVTHKLSTRPWLQGFPFGLCLSPLYNSQVPGRALFGNALDLSMRAAIDAEMLVIIDACGRVLHHAAHNPGFRLPTYWTHQHPVAPGF